MVVTVQGATSFLRVTTSQYGPRGCLFIFDRCSTDYVRPAIINQAYLFTGPVPSMSSLNLTCLQVARPHRNEPDENTIQVNLYTYDTVSLLKKLIKNEYTHRFSGYDACDLVLWKCSIPIDNNLKENLEKIRFDGTDPSVQRIRPAASVISEHFSTNLPYKTIQILVRLAW